MTIKEEGKIQIHTENIFPIIKKAVYSDHEIFLRELISNSVDAIKKRKMAAIGGDCIADDNEIIEISIDKEQKTITISDNGIGMTSEEVKKYINQVAFSSAEEFLDKYQKDKDEIIGHFGLGFYSSFMVASKVEIKTQSAVKDIDAIKWSCDGSPNFSLEDTQKDSIGTEITLFLMEEELEYLEPQRIKTLVSKYCDYMNVEIKFEGETINKMNPPWKRNQNELEDKAYIDFYKSLYPFQGEPLLWVHLSTDYPYNLQGILYFPKVTGRADWENGEIKLYCNQVYVSDSIKEIVPRYLIPLRGVIDSPDIPLNVSRSALQSDRRVKSIGNFVSKKVADKLKQIKNEKPSFYAEIWESIAPFIKIGAMEDEKFASQVEELLIFKTDSDTSLNGSDLITSGSNTYTTLKSYLDRLTSDDKKILYYTEDMSQSPALAIWKSQGAEVIKLDNIIDTQFISWLEAKDEKIKFQRVDAEITEQEDEEKKEISTQDGVTETDIIRNIFREAISNENVTVKINSLNVDEAPPTIILLPEQMRRINDIGALMEQKIPGLPEHHVLLINQNHSLIKALLKLKSGSVIITNKQSSPTEDLTKDLAKHLYSLAKSSIGGLDAKGINELNTSTATLMATLLERSI